MLPSGSLKNPHSSDSHRLPGKAAPGFRLDKQFARGALQRKRRLVFPLVSSSHRPATGTRTVRRSDAAGTRPCPHRHPCGTGRTRALRSAAAAPSRPGFSPPAAALPGTDSQHPLAPHRHRAGCDAETPTAGTRPSAPAPKRQPLPRSAPTSKEAPVRPVGMRRCPGEDGLRGRRSRIRGGSRSKTYRLPPRTVPRPGRGWAAPRTAREGSGGAGAASGRGEGESHDAAEGDPAPRSGWTTLRPPGAGRKRRRPLAPREAPTVG